MQAEAEALEFDHHALLRAEALLGLARHAGEQRRVLGRAQQAVAAQFESVARGDRDAVQALAPQRIKLFKGAAGNDRDAPVQPLLRLGDQGVQIVTHHNGVGRGDNRHKRAIEI